jgi:Tfp pilus assembly protein PilX
MSKLKAKKLLSNKSGFALLFAVLTASLLLTIGLSIFGISFKELTISTAARESQVAFYAADSARECALYWDVKKGDFPACLNSGCTQMTAPANVTSLIKCNGASTSFITSTPGNGQITYASTGSSPFIKFGTDSLNPESDIFLSKTLISQNILTNITALGHNVGSSGNRLERGISQTY